MKKIIEEIIIIVIFVVLVWFVTAETLEYWPRITLPMFLYKNLGELVLITPHIMIALTLGLLIAPIFGYLIKRRIVIYSMAVVVPTIMVFVLFSTWPANKWIPITGHIIVIISFTGVAYFTQRLTKRSKAQGL